MAQDNTRSLIYWSRPGPGPASSWILFRFLTCYPWELQDYSYCFNHHIPTNKLLLEAFFFFLFRATFMAHGGSQARGLIGATAAGLRHGHSNAGSELCNLMVPSWIHFPCTTMGTPHTYIFVYNKKESWMNGKGNNSLIIFWLDGKSNNVSKGSSCCDSMVMNPIGIHEDVASIPRLAHWVKDLVFSWAVM